MKHKAITLNEHIIKTLGLDSRKLTYELQKSLEQKEKLQKLASKITKIPETVRIYPVPLELKGEKQ